LLDRLSGNRDCDPSAIGTYSQADGSGGPVPATLRPVAAQMVDARKAYGRAMPL
jgi:hypothetical protein